MVNLYQQQRVKRYNRIVLLAIILPSVIGLTIYAVYNYRLNTGRDARLAPFQAHIAAYTDKATLCPTCPLCEECDISYRKTIQPGQMMPTPQERAGYLRGKAIVIDTFNKVVSPLTLQLPDALRPTQPAEVASVIWMRCTAGMVGRYSSGATANQTACVLTAVDLSAPAIVGVGEVLGPEPPRVITGSNPGSAAMPSDQELIAYIAGLPRQ